MIFTINTRMDVFIDVPNNHWAKDRIVWAVENRFMNGASENLFMPERLVTRDDYFLWVARFVKRIAQKAAPPALQRADGLITREEAVYVLSQAAGALGIVTTMEYIPLGGIYGDCDDIDPAYMGAFQTAYKLGLIPQTAAPGMLDPKGHVTRAQTAAGLHRLHEIRSGMDGHTG